MSVFLYFLPGSERVTRDMVAKSFAAVALRDLIASNKRFDRIVVQNPVYHAGPGGQAGAVFAALPGGMEIEGIVPHYMRDSQTWVEAEGGWLGWYTDHPPIPENLRREHVTSGVPIELGDGRAWEVATVRRANGENMLPHSWGCDKAGRFARVMLADHEADWRLAGEIWSAFTGETSCNRGEAWGLAIRALGINHRVGAHEASALRLLNDENFESVFQAVADWNTVQSVIDEEVKKKAESHSQVSSIEAGPQGEC